MMKTQQSYSHGLLYSIAPGSLSSLHLNDDIGRDKFYWEAYKAENKGNTLAQIVASFLKKTAVSWGLIKPH